MPITTLSSREFNQFSGRAKRAAQKGPVIITDRGEPSYVLLTFDDYDSIIRQQPSIGDLLSSPETADIDFDPPRMNFQAQPVEFD
jgi:prevent-host-death family protein